MNLRKTIPASLMALVLLGVAPSGVEAEDQVVLGQGPGQSTQSGVSFRPADLPYIPAVPANIPRGYDFDISAMKAQPAIPSSVPEVILQSREEQGSLPNAPPLSTNFQGIGYTGWYPPDPILAAGPSHVIECVNSSFRISTKAGATVSTTTFASWWSPVITNVKIFDPKIHYDHHAGRWVILAVGLDNSPGTRSYYLIATSHTSDPTGSWCGWYMYGDVNATTQVDNWADYPQLGLDDTAFYITSNQFGKTSGSFEYSRVRILGKAQFYANTCGALSWYDFWSMEREGGSKAFTLQPALTFGTVPGGKEYLICSWSSSGSEVTLFSITNPLGLSPNAAPVFTRESTIPVKFYSSPPDAAQPGSLEKIDTGDCRLLNCVYRDGQIYTTHTIAGETSPTTSAVRVLRISAAAPIPPTLDMSFGYVTDYLSYPAIMPTSTGSMALVYNHSGPSTFAGSRYMVLDPLGNIPPGFDSVLKAGEATYVREDGSGRNRWGDYSGIALDPTDSCKVWICSEHSRPNNEWGSWVGSLPACVASVDPCFLVAVDKQAYVNGETVNVTRFEFSNPGPADKAVEIKVWLDIAGLPELSILNLGTDGSFVLPAGFTLNLANTPIPFVPVSAGLPRGAYKLGARTINWITARQYCQSIADFNIVDPQ